MTSIRRALPTDAKNLAALAERTFRDAFGDANTADDMNLHCRTRYGEALQLAEINDPEIDTLVCVARDQLIAYAQLHRAGAPSCVQGTCPGEIRRFYVSRAWHGKGIAQALMSACLEALKHRGSDLAWLGVWERNPRALRFYRKEGFVEVGDHVFTLGSDPQRDIVMVCPTSRG